MKKISHLTPRYIANRIALAIDQQLRPGDPWITRSAIGALDTLLRASDVGVEFGSGRSTKWFANRIAKLTSVEHNRKWYEKVRDSLSSRNVTNVDYLLVEANSTDVKANANAYTSVLQNYSDESIDFALVDGAYRGTCAYRVIPKLKRGGVLVIDNVNWFLPSSSTAPESRSYSDGPDTAENWPEVHRTLESWRKIWSTNGVWDTAIFFKP
ncbi:class I SAM-dependent methyltransferase [Mesorhizobium sp. M1378]|uniref:O-methyltransferase n=1 Tax=Mesorhizobium sp. M1378 TaxID=2957092 RepID=UPI0033358AF9